MLHVYRKFHDCVGLKKLELKFAEEEERAAKFLASEGPQLQSYLWFKWLISANYVTDWWEK